MKPETFDDLTHEQHMAMAIAMHVRNELEDFHCDHVPDNLMPELNCTIRYAIYDFFEDVVKDQQKLAWLVMMIPDCWEIPGHDPKPTFTGEHLGEGKPYPKRDDPESNDDYATEDTDS